MALLSDTDAVIDALGGTGAVAAIVGCSSQRVSNWRVSGFFPPDTFESLCRALSGTGMSAPLSLWRHISTDQFARMRVVDSRILIDDTLDAPRIGDHSLATTQIFFADACAP